ERTDGHRFLEDAVAAGATALVVTQEIPGDRLDALTASGDVTVVRVDDAAAALCSVAASYRTRFDPLVVGITGSLAKTSTKEQVAEVLEERFEVLRNPANWNNEIGLPMTLLRLRPEHEVAVLEMGLYTTGEIALLAQLARPSIGIVTAVRGVHLSRAGSIEAIEAGKRELVEALPADGWAILNADDPRVLGMAGDTRARVLTYGFSDAAEVRATDIRSLGAAGMRFKLQLPQGVHEVTTPVLGRHGVHNALAAAAVATCVDMAIDDIIRGLGRDFVMPHRSQLISAGAWTILDDSYNASPDAVLAALGLLAELPGRRIAVLGEMLELGDAAAAEHRRVGEHAADVADELIVVGEGAQGIADGAIGRGMDTPSVRLAADRDEALSLLLAVLRDGDTVLLKASRGAEFDLLVEKLVLAAGAGEAEA
ncbi:MAG: UDP-N-acetylmuramoyl-tripeptide--D-alanyl-D-alanine ligase, partial [Chloroflexota bacterium]|nr:UDP-N-acetylmuramoyl-tripeptide--D-alanyl-D-alanine ligase [Chloroflexota bacterium]